MGSNQNEYPRKRKKTQTSNKKLKRKVRVDEGQDDMDTTTPPSLREGGQDPGNPDEEIREFNKVPHVILERCNSGSEKGRRSRERSAQSARTNPGSTSAEEADNEERSQERIPWEKRKRLRGRSVTTGEYEKKREREEEERIRSETEDESE